MDFLFAADRALLLFFNRSLSNPVGDALWPLITDYVTFWPVRIALLALWLWLLIRGGTRGRTAAIMLVPVLVISDQLNSSVIKEIVARPRPCHLVEGVPVMEGLRLLVDCGAGKSFCSSHAVNNFAVATVFAFSYPRAKWAFFGWAALVGLSRAAVGVHYPSDIIAGALLGVLVAWAVLSLWRYIQLHFSNSRPDVSPQQSHQ